MVRSVFGASLARASRASRRLYGSLFFAVVILAALPAPHVGAAGCEGACKGNEILVGEDDRGCHCQNRVAYARCVGNAGRSLERTLSTCETVRACLRRNEIHEEIGFCAASLLLVPLSAAQPGALPLTIGGTAVTCAWLTRDGLNKARDCLKSTPSTCNSNALLTHRADLKRCKEE